MNRGRSGRRWKGGEQEIWNKIIKTHESRKKPVRAVSREIARRAWRVGKGWKSNF